MLVAFFFNEKVESIILRSLISRLNENIEIRLVDQYNLQNRVEIDLARDQLIATE